MQSILWFDLKRSFDRCRRSGIACRDPFPGEACAGGRPNLYCQVVRQMSDSTKMPRSESILRRGSLRLLVRPCRPVAPSTATDDRTFPAQRTRKVKPEVL